MLDYPILSLKKEESFKVINGQTIAITLNDGNYLLVDDNNERAIVKIQDNKAKMSIFLD